MTENKSAKVEIPTGGGSGLVVEHVEINGAPCVRLSFVLDGIANRITLEPIDALGVAYVIAGFSEEAHLAGKGEQRKRRKIGLAPASEAIN